MKLLKLSFIGMLLLSVFASTSCKKDDEAAPQFELTDIIGTWEIIGGDDFVACPDGDNQIITITATSLSEGLVSEDGCAIAGSLTMDYEFKNGNTLDVGLGQYIVTSLTATDMTIKITSLIAPDYKPTWNLKKVQ